MESPTRGIVISHKATIGPIKFTIEPPPLKQILMLATYWDRIIIAEVGEVQFSLGEMTPLVDEGIVSFTQIDYDWDKSFGQSDTVIVSGYPASIYYALLMRAPFDVCAELSRDKGMLWCAGKCLENVAAGLAYPDNEESETDAVQISLINALPVPAPGTRAEKILDLRARRRPELLALRAALDDLFQAILQDEHKQLSFIRAKEKIELSLLDLQRVLDEGKVRRLAATVKTYLSLGDLSASSIMMPALGAAVSGGTGASPAWGVFGGLAANAALTFASDYRKPTVLPAEAKDFAYLYYAKKMAGHEREPDPRKLTALEAALEAADQSDDPSAALRKVRQDFGFPVGDGEPAPYEIIVRGRDG